MTTKPKISSRQIKGPLEEGKAQPDGLGSASLRSRTSELTRRAILLISDEVRLYDALKPLANAAGRMVVRLNLAASAVAVLRAVNPAVVLLDLDLPNRAARKAAEALLQEPACPPIMLLSASSDRFNAASEARAGSLVDKSAEPAHLLAMVEETLAMPYATDAGRKVIQRFLTQGVFGR